MPFEDTICAASTAPGVGALGVIRVSGKNAIPLVDSIFKGKNLNEVNSHTVHYGFIVSSKEEGAETVDEVMVSVFRAPKTFTAEDLVEISCHGSPFIQQQILDLLVKKGGRLAAPGEFTQRAFLNGRIDLSQAEAVADLIAAQNKASHHVALNQMRGGISGELKNLREKLIDFTALIELELDFSDEDVEFADRQELKDLVKELQEKIGVLASTFEYGNAIKNGVPVAIIGKPNAGKSTLLNALLNEERAIVSDIAGTTRDTIEETLTLDGITFRFIDTAGIRHTEDEIEAIGVEKAREKAEQARVIIHLYEDAPDLLDELETVLEDKVVFNLMNKIDKHDLWNEEYKKALSEKYPNYKHFGVAVKTGLHLEEVKKELVEEIKSGIDENAVIITNVRHKEALINAMQALDAVKAGMQSGLPGDLLSFHLREALRDIGSITGEIEVDRDILGTIFGKFCIGK